MFRDVGGGDIREMDRCRASSWWDFLVWESARLGKAGASPLLDEVEERGVLAALAGVGLVTVAERLGKCPGDGRGSDATGASSSGVVTEVEEDEVAVGDVSLSSVVPDRKDEEEVTVLRSGAL